VVYQKINNTTKSEKCFRRAIELDSSYSDPVLNLATQLYRQEENQEAISYFEKLTALSYKTHKYYYFYGCTAYKLEDPVLAIQLFLDAVKIYPTHAPSYHNLGLAYKMIGDFKTAIPYFEKALELDGDYDLSKKALTYTFLSLGEFQNGWSYYDYRHIDFEDPIQCNLPLWDPNTPEKVNLLVKSAEGIGDELMYSAHIPKLAERTNTIYYEVDRRLLPLFSRTFPEVNFFNRADPELFSTIESKCQQYVDVGNLPRYIEPNLDFSCEHPLKSDSEKREKYYHYYRNLYPNRRIIGISYQTFSKNAATRMPKQAFWENIFDAYPDDIFINLQENQRTEKNKCCFLYGHERIIYEENFDLFSDLDDLAALIDSLNAVIAIDNSIANLAGRLAKNVLVLIPNSFDWRWPITLDQSPWYPTATLIRQQKHAEWEGLDQIVIDVLKDIKKFEGKTLTQESQ